MTRKFVRVFENRFDRKSKLKYLTLISCKQATIHSHLFNGMEWELFLSITLIDFKKLNFNGFYRLIIDMKNVFFYLLIK